MVEDIARDGAADAAVADTQRAGGDRGAAGVSASARQRQRARTLLGQAPAIPARGAIGGHVMQVGADGVRHARIERERAMRLAALVQPAQVIGGQIAHQVLGLAGGQGQVIDLSFVAVEDHPRKVALDAAVCFEQRHAAPDLVGDAGHQESDVGAEGHLARGQADGGRRVAQRVAQHQRRAVPQGCRSGQIHRDGRMNVQRRPAGHGHAAAQRVGRGGRAVAEFQGSGGDPGVAAIRIGTRQGQDLGAVLDERPRAGHGAGVGHRVAAIEDHRRGAGDIAGHEPGRAAVTDAQRAAFERGQAGIGVVARQGQRVGPLLGNRALAGNGARVGHRAAAVVDQLGMVDDIASYRAGRAAVTDAQRAGVDRRHARVGVASGQGEDIVAVLGDPAPAGDDARVGHWIAAIEGQRGVVEDIARDGAGDAAVAQPQRASDQGGPAGVGMVASQGQRAIPAGAGVHGIALVDLPRAGNHAFIRRIIAAHEEQLAAIVDNIARHGTGGAVVAHEQRAVGVADARAAGVGVVAGQDQHAVRERDRTRTRNHVVVGVPPGAAVVEMQRGVTGQQDRTGHGTGEAAVAQAQHAPFDEGLARVGVLAGQGQRVGPSLGDRAHAGNDARVGCRIGAVEDQRGAVEDIARQGTGGAAITDPQRAGDDGGSAGVGVIAGQRQRAGPILHPVIEGIALENAARAGNHAVIGDVVAAGEEQLAAIVEDIARHRTGCAAVADPQRAAQDPGAAAIGIRAGQGQRTAAGLRHDAVAGDDARVRQPIAAVENHLAAIDDVAIHRAGAAAITHAQRACFDGGQAKIAVVAAQDQGARPALGQAVAIPVSVGSHPPQGRADVEFLVRAEQERAVRPGRRIEPGELVTRQVASAVVGFAGAQRQEIRDTHAGGRGVTVVGLAPNEDAGEIALDHAVGGAEQRGVGRAGGRDAGQIEGDPIADSHGLDPPAFRRLAFRCARRCDGQGRAVVQDGGPGHVDRCRRMDGQRGSASHGDAAAQRIGGAEGPAEFQRAGADRGVAVVGIGAGQIHRVGADLADRPGAGNDARVRQRVAAVKDQCAGIGDIAGQRSGRAAVADAQRAALDRGRAGIGVVAGQDQRVGALLDHRPLAGDDAGVGRRVAAIEDQRGLVGDIARHHAGRAATADTQRAGVDGGQAGVGVVAGQGQRAGALLGDGAHAGYDPRVEQFIAAIEDQRGIVADVSCDGTGQAAVADPKRAVRNRGAAGVGAVARQRQRARSPLGQAPAVPAAGAIGGHVMQVGANGVRQVGTDGERAMGPAAGVQPGQVIVRQITRLVLGLPGGQGQVIDPSFISVRHQPGEVAFDAAGRAEQRRVAHDPMSDAGQRERDVLAEEHLAGAEAGGGRLSLQRAAQDQGRTVMQRDISIQPEGIARESDFGPRPDVQAAGYPDGLVAAVENGQFWRSERLVVMRQYDIAFDAAARLELDLPGAAGQADGDPVGAVFRHRDIGRCPLFLGAGGQHIRNRSGERQDGTQRGGRRVQAERSTRGMTGHAGQCGRVRPRFRRARSRFLCSALVFVQDAAGRGPLSK